MSERKYPVAEIFSSINGEGPLAGQLAVFVRFQGCNLRCRYCDTAWANAADAPCTRLSASQILSSVRESGISNVTLTGGEPLLQEGLEELICLLARDGRHIEIETNGSLDLGRLDGLRRSKELPSRQCLSFTMDYKLACSGMEEAMYLPNLKLLQPHDTLKFVAGSREDCQRAAAIIRDFSLQGKCGLYISTVFGELDPAKVVDFMKEEGLNGVNLQLQLHKYIWDPLQRGV